MAKNRIFRSIQQACERVSSAIFYKFYAGLRSRILTDPKIRDLAVLEFHKLYYYSLDRTWNNTYWMNVPLLKCPLDVWVYQEMIVELKPDVIIECGTARGSSALFMAHICDMAGKGKIITIDIKHEDNRPQHKRVTYLTGSSIAPEIVEQAKAAIGKNDKVMIFLDSDHTMAHVLSELRIYNSLVSKGSYLIVEDSNVNGHPVEPSHGPGPMEAVKEFLKENKDFVIDKEREKFFLTFNPNGYLKKVA